MSNISPSSFSGLQDSYGFWEGREQHRPVPLSVPTESLATFNTHVARYGTFVSPPLGHVEDSKGRNRFLKSAAPSGNFSGGLGYASYSSFSPGSPYSIELKDHCHQQWIVVLLTVLLFLGVSYQILIVQVPPTGSDCGSRFGSILGMSKHVIAYSNCRYSYRGEGIQNYVTVGLHRIYTGAKWNSIEYARRYWILRRFMIIPTLSSPEQLMNITEVMTLSNSMSKTTVALKHFWNLDGPLPLESYNNTSQGLPRRGTPTMQEATKVSQPNLTKIIDRFPLAFQSTEVDASFQNPCTSYRGNSSLPQSGDLLVYAKNRSTLSHGHVAVIVGVKGPYNKPDLNTVSSLPEDGKDPEKLNTTYGDGGTVQDSVNAPTNVSDPRNGIQADKSIMGNTMTNTDESSFLENRINFQHEYVYYKVYLAEQNWDNRPWTGIYNLSAGTNQNYSPSIAANSNINLGTNGLPQQSTESVLHTRVESKDKDVRMTDVEKELLENEKPRSYSRILILRDYRPSCVLYLEDNLGQRILGWVRPDHLKDT
ncbi:unnamed protein product [Phytomonas sp. Hart1]|nr:unnamed protein product [Phytomonas sp. Hart1]|eukprot:CCW69344.1 unnamed protein product [Phytomonas sp. isolate Hart1]